MASENKPNRRGAHRTVSVGGSLYVWAGRQAGFSHDSEEKRRLNSNIQHFTPSTGQWTTRNTTGTPPLGIWGYLCTPVDDGQLYYFGGYCGHGDCYHNSITQLNTVSLQWRELEPTDAARPVMRRAYGGMISFEHGGVHHLLVIGGIGSKPAVQLPHNNYIELPKGRWRTNEHSLYNISSKKWTNPLIIGQCIPPASGFTIETIDNTRAVLFGGIERTNDHDDAVINNVCVLTLKTSISTVTVVWECMKKPLASDQWPLGRYGHAGTVIITGPDCPKLVISGGKNKKNDTLGDCWIFNITERFWIKLDVPQSFGMRRNHSLSVFPRCTWMITVGGFLDKCFTLVADPNIVMLTELVANSQGGWTIGDTLDTNGMNSEKYKKKYEQQHNEQSIQALMKIIERETLEFSQRMEQKEAEKEQEIERYRTQLQEKNRELLEKDMELQDNKIALSNEPWVINKDEVTLTKEELGRGSYAVVTVGIFRGLRVAVKSLHTIIISDYNQGLFSREMSIASQVRHPNLVQFIGATKVGNPLILTELMSTSLNQEICRNRLTNQQILSIAQDVALGLNYLHLFKPQPIIHRDVSSPNVLLKPCTGPAGYEAKVADYGTVKVVQANSTHIGTYMPGNPAYSAPEAPIPDQHNPAMDVYSYSVLLMEMNLHCPPEMTTILREQQSDNVSWSDMKSLIQKGLNANPRARPTMDQVIDLLKRVDI